jgi:hypothetical protein
LKVCVRKPFALLVGFQVMTNVTPHNALGGETTVVQGFPSAPGPVVIETDALGNRLCELLKMLLSSG